MNIAKSHLLQSLILLTVAAFAAGCEKVHPVPDFVEVLPILFDGLYDHDWYLLDSAGRRMNLWQGSWVLNAAEGFVYKGQRFETPILCRKRAVRIVAGQHPHGEDTLTVPVSGSPKQVTAFEIIELPSRKIFICGGMVNGLDSASLAATWLYDPDKRRIEPGPDMKCGRGHHRLTLLKDGRVLISGGLDGDKILRSVEVFDPVAGNITALTDMSLPRASHGAVQLNNGLLLIVGGITDEKFSDANDNVTSTVELMDLSSLSSKLVGRMLIERTSPIILAVGDCQAVVAGGVHMNESYDYRFVRDAEIMKPLRAAK